ncbi:MAG: ABC transporter ATP-binding protein/permease, partial [Thioalkalispiraceae bacterium]
VFTTVFIYIGFTLMITNWRMHYRHEMNSLDSKANGQAVDSLLNYETVKYFNNERHELHRYDNTLDQWENMAVKSQTSMSLLNFGQGGIIAVGLTFIMVYAGQGVMQGTMSLGDLVLVNTMMLQLFMPLNFLGIIYRMLRHTLADMDMVLRLLESKPEIIDKPDARELSVTKGTVSFENVSFSYNDEREILKGISFTVPAGSKLGIVGASGAGKSTLSRLLFRFYEVQSGCIRIDGQDISQVTQQSLRKAIGIVPQDTVLFNDTIYYNIQYARPGASREEVIKAAKMANLHRFIEGLPDGYETLVGERGLKLSGGEKQRVAIARVILKNAPVLVFDEATSSLDSRSEKSILASLKSISEHHTTLAIAHRLSTIVDADHIIVIEDGQIIEQGTHQSLLDKDGHYASMWHLQQEQQALPEVPEHTTAV